MNEALPRARVLYVEDRLDTSRAWTRNLEAAGLDVAPANSLEEALTLWRELQGQISLAILDVDLSESSPPGPEDGGLQVGEAIVRDTMGVNAGLVPELMILTSHSENPQYLHRAIDLGVAAFVSKDSSQAPEHERDEPYRIEAYAQVLCARAVLLSTAVRERLSEMVESGYFRTTSQRRFRLLIDHILRVCLGPRPWSLSEPASTTVVETGPPRSRHAQPGNDGTPAIATVGEGVRLLEDQSGYQLSLVLGRMPPSAAPPEHEPLLIQNLIMRYFVGPLRTQFSALQASSERSWGPTSDERRVLLRLKESLCEDNGLFAETVYSAAFTLDRIRRVHKGALCSIYPASNGQRLGLVVAADGYRPDPGLFKQAAGNDWELVSDSLQLASVVENPERPNVWVDQVLAKNDLFAVLDLADNSVLTLDRADLMRTLNPTIAACAARAEPERYRVKLDRVSPVSAGPLLKAQTKCFIGISLENPNFERDELLVPVLDWIADRFKECRVVIGDGIHRLTRQIRNSRLDEASALMEAIGLGTQFVERRTPLFESYAGRCSFVILRMSDFIRDADVVARTENLAAFKGANAPYAAEVAKFAEMFVRRQSVPERGGDATAARAITLATRYLIEEAAFCGFMADSGWNVLVYPGPIDPFRAVSDGEIPDAPEALRRLQFVCLKLKRIWAPGERPPRVQVSEEVE